MNDSNYIINDTYDDNLQLQNLQNSMSDYLNN